MNSQPTVASTFAAQTSRRLHQRLAKELFFCPFSCAFLWVIWAHQINPVGHKT